MIRIGIRSPVVALSNLTGRPTSLNLSKNLGQPQKGQSQGQPVASGPVDSKKCRRIIADVTMGENMWSFVQVKVVSVFLAGLVFGASAHAQVLEPDLIARQLSADAAGPVVTTLASQDALVFDTAAPIPTAFDLPSIDVSIAFDGNSHLLTAEGMTALRSVAMALNDARLADQTFQVASHLVLPDDPNSAQRVSNRRAQIVAEHLSVYYDLSSSRLIPVGYGAGSLREPGIPNSPLNTRIQFINVLSK